jgi:hypothetical protein
MKRRGRKPPMLAEVNGIRKYIPNPEWLDSAMAKQEIEEAKDYLAENSGWPLQDFFPEDYDKQIPADGAWIQLLSTVRVGHQVDNGMIEEVNVPHLSIWYAMPTCMTHGVAAGNGLEFPLRLGIINTKQGEVRVFPHEYNIVSQEALRRWLAFTEQDGFYIHFLSDSGAFDADKIFYMRSRGLDLAECRRLLLPELKDPNFCYFTFHEEYSRIFGEGFGSGLLHQVNHDRRAESKRRRAAA